MSGQQRGQSAQQQAAQEDLQQGPEGGGHKGRTQNVELVVIYFKIDNRYFKIDNR